MFVGLVVVLVTRPMPLRASLLVAYGAGIGVLIDLDHFIISRVNTGQWTAVRRCLGRPFIVIFDQDAIFEDGEIGKFRRLLSHALVGAGIVLVVWPVDPFIAGFTAVIVYCHVVADLIHDIREVDDPVEWPS